MLFRIGRALLFGSWAAHGGVCQGGGSSPCDDATHRQFVYDAASGLCQCPVAHSLSGGVFTCHHPGPYVVNEAATQAAKEEQYRRAGAEVDRLGSTRAASVAIGVCAQGANRLLKSKQQGGVILGSCMEALGAASRLKDSERLALEGLGQGEKYSAELEADALADEEETRKELATVEGSYGVKPEEFRKRVLRSRGERKALAKVLERRVSAQDFEAALDLAEKLGEERRRKILAELKTPGASLELVYRPGAPRSEISSLRDHLYSLAHSTNPYGEPVASPGGPADASDPEVAGGAEQFAKLSRPKPGLGDIRDLSSVSLLEPEEELEELTLFEVMHRKYRGKEMFRRLLPGVRIGGLR